LSHFQIHICLTVSTLLSFKTEEESKTSIIIAYVRVILSKGKYETTTAASAKCKQQQDKDNMFA